MKKIIFIILMLASFNLKADIVQLTPSYVTGFRYYTGNYEYTNLFYSQLFKSNIFLSTTSNGALLKDFIGNHNGSYGFYNNQIIFITGRSGIVYYYLYWNTATNQVAMYYYYANSYGIRYAYVTSFIAKLAVLKTSTSTPSTPSGPTTIPSKPQSYCYVLQQQIANLTKTLSTMGSNTSVSVTMMRMQLASMKSDLQSGNCKK